MQEIHTTKNPPATSQNETIGTSERRRVEAVVETLAMVGSRGETLAEVAHDARNMVTALGLYCDLLDEPGVLSAPFSHYASELRLVAGASRRLVEKLVALDAHASATSDLPAIEDENDEWPAQLNPELLQGEQFVPRSSAQRSLHTTSVREVASAHITSLAAELLANQNLLAALAGPGVTVSVNTFGGALPVGMNAEDLTRILVNLVKNAAEAMNGKGAIDIVLAEQTGQHGGAELLTLSLEDNGPGIPEEALEKVFESGFSSHRPSLGRSAWTSTHRGLGLAITRSIVEAAGGRISAANRPTRGAKFEIELPVSAAR